VSAARLGEPCMPVGGCIDTCSENINGNLSICTSSDPVLPGMPCTEDIQCAPIYLNDSYAVLSCANSLCFGIPDGAPCYNYGINGDGCMNDSICVINGSEAAYREFGVCGRKTINFISEGQRCVWPYKPDRPYCRFGLSCYPTDILGNGTCLPDNQRSVGGLCTDHIQCDESYGLCNFNTEDYNWGYCVQVNSTESSAPCQEDEDCAFGQSCDCAGVDTPRCFLPAGTVNRPGSAAVAKALYQCVLAHECTPSLLYLQPCAACRSLLCDYNVANGRKAYYDRLRAYLQQAVPSCASGYFDYDVIYRDFKFCGWWDQTNGSTTTNVVSSTSSSGAISTGPAATLTTTAATSTTATATTTTTSQKTNASSAGDLSTQAIILLLVSVIALLF